MGIDIKFTGLKELKDKLAGLEYELQYAIGRKATGVMAGIVQKEAKARVHLAKDAYYTGPRGQRVKVQPGHVARNTVVKRIPAQERQGLLSEHIVTVVSSGKAVDGAAGARNIAVFLEYGINMPRPYPFLRPAFDAKQNDALAAGRRVIEAELQKIWNK